VAMPFWNKSKTNDKASLAALPEMLRLRERISETFDSDNQDNMSNLEKIWTSLRTDPCAVPSEGWKELGFQGSDPCTDVRAGGALAMDFLEYVAVVHPEAYKTMLRKVEGRVFMDGVTGMCPLGTTAVILSRLICDEAGITQPMRPPLATDELQDLVLHGDRRPLWKFLTNEANALELFACLLMHFFARYWNERVTYMQLQENTQAIKATLDEWAHAASSWDALRDRYANDMEITAAIGEWSQAFAHTRGYVQELNLDRDVKRLRAQVDFSDKQMKQAELRKSQAEDELRRMEDAMAGDLARVANERA